MFDIDDNLLFAHEVVLIFVKSLGLSKLPRKVFLFSLRKYYYDLLDSTIEKLFYCVRSFWQIFHSNDLGIY